MLARDRVRGGQVAVKELLRASTGALLGFKREFRALAGLSHPNLVTLYELIAEGPRWLLTMEFIAGLPLLESLRGASPGPQSRGGSATSRTSLSSGRVGAGGPAVVGLVRRDRGTAPRRVARAGSWRRRAVRRFRARPAANAMTTDGSRRLCAAFLQVARGVQALHSAGIVHRDLKPANIQVEAGGRVVILDFGLAALVDQEAGSTAIVGTPRYMSPEQARGAPVEAASDWYSVGVLLHEAIFGVAPIEGSPHEVMARKQYLLPARRPPPANVPSALVDLCFQLLTPVAAERPGGPAVLKALAALAVPAKEAALAGPEDETSPPEAVLVGRDDAWTQLRGAWALARGGAVVVAVVRGPAGIGKTALCRAFLAERRAAGAWVLTGRCHVHEQIPFKAIDEVIDGLGLALLGLDLEARAGLLSAGRGALVRLFPALAPALAWTVDAAPADEDKGLVRRAASQALRELLLGLAARVPLMLAIDDLQWGDVDSVLVLAELLRPP
ncbi:MAG: serine/threonine-protein kinase PknK, partial [Myxococcales bacterium]|nr:serine/threonine-protein kinase PknK [Myxococcales bacterium]